MIRPLRRWLASQPAVAWVSPGPWGLVARQLPGVVRRSAELRQATVERAQRARAAMALAALRARPWLGAAPVELATVAPIWAERVAVVEAVVVAREQVAEAELVVVAPEQVVAAAAPEPAVAVLARVAAARAGLRLVAAVPVARVARAAAPPP